MNIDMDKPRTGIPSQKFKDNWDAIFGKQKTPAPTLCGSCGIDRTNGAMCQACTDAIQRRESK